MKQFKYLVWFIVLMLISCLGFIYYNLGDQKIIVGVKVGGVSLGGLSVAAAEELLKDKAETLLNKSVEFYAENYLLKTSLGKIGLRIDQKAIAAQAYLLGRSGSIWSRITSRRMIRLKGQDLKPELSFDEQVLNNFFGRLEHELAISPVRAIVTLTPQGKVSYTKEEIGRTIGRQELLARLRTAVVFEKISRIEIPLQKINPVLNVKEIHQWGLDNVLGIYTTSYNQNNVDREHNIVNASAAIDNVLIFPKQSFSFNSWVGPRLSLTGYREAPIIYQGKLIPGVGGGVCQVSSTLYNVVLLANLSVIKRINHSLVSSYVPLARDAAVADGVVDFSFQNLNTEPILIVAKAKRGQLTMAIMGKKDKWLRVELETVVLEEYSFGTKEILDKTCPLGERIKVQSGKLGYKAELWRTVYFNNGEVKHEKVNTSIYKSQIEEYKIGVENFENETPVN